MLVLFESASGYSLFKVLDDDKVQQVDNIQKAFASSDAANKTVQLKEFSSFDDTVEALSSLTKSNKGKIPKKLKSFLKKQITKKGLTDTLAVHDVRLANVIKEKLQISCLYNSNILEVMRGIRSNFDSLVPDLTPGDLHKMSLGLAHSLSRYKMKFTADKLDTMVIQAVSLLDDLDKELNNYVMRLREWYGWHFPELSSLINDGVKYAKVVKLLGVRNNASKTDFAEVLNDESLEQSVKSAAEVSIGTEISDLDVLNINMLCDQIIDMSHYREELSNYLTNRMNAVAPNLSILVGEIVGARLIAHAGSVMNLAKNPSSTVQILGAEKALFRALKASKNTPKYGFLYHSSVVSQASTQHKGRMSRSLAAKAALAVRCDALSENEINTDLAVKNRAILESRLKHMEQITNKKSTGSGKFVSKFDKYSKNTDKTSYDSKSDFTLHKPEKRSHAEDAHTTLDTFKKFKESTTDENETSILVSEPSVLPESSVLSEQSSGKAEKKKKKKKKAKKSEESTTQV